jgi:hypothetical protein
VGGRRVFPALLGEPHLLRLLRLLLEVDTSPVLLLLLLLLLGVELGLVGVQRRASFHAGRWRHRRRVVLLLLQVSAVEVEVVVVVVVVVHGRLVGARGGAIHVLRGAAVELHGIPRTREGHLLLELGLLHHRRSVVRWLG